MLVVTVDTLELELQEGGEVREGGEEIIRNLAVVADDVQADEVLEGCENCDGKCRRGVADVTRAP